MINSKDHHDAKAQVKPRMVKDFHSEPKKRSIGLVQVDELSCGISSASWKFGKPSSPQESKSALKYLSSSINDADADVDANFKWHDNHRSIKKRDTT